MNAKAEYPPDEVPRILRARKPSYIHRPIIAITRDSVLVENLREQVFDIGELPMILNLAPSSILVCQGFGQHLQRLQREYEHNPRFNYRVTPIRRYARPWNHGDRDSGRVDQGLIVDAVCNFVGWASGDKHKPNRYHYPIDPIWFLTASIDQLDDSDTPRLLKLYRWARQVREWCRENDLHVKASAGGLAAQLLRDPRFWPEPRRKAPRMINEIARFQLPGNYYRLFADENRPYHAVYLDMENAHHEMARFLRFPGVNRLHAYGDWSFETRVAKDHTAKPRLFTTGDSDILNRPGLHYLRLSVPFVPDHLFPHPCMAQPGEKNVYLYSNELELIRELGGKVLGVYASYCSNEIDPGMNRYAKFAIEQIRTHRDCKPWLKPTLHAAYGMLAARPVAFETGHFRAAGGTRGEYHMGNVSLPVWIHANAKEIESRTANVIHRGMIEAQVRIEALNMARTLTQAYRAHVLAIYADAIFVEDRFRDYAAHARSDAGRPFPILPPPWRVSKYVSHLRFLSPVHFTSPDLSRLPGVPRTARERYLRAREDIRYLNTVRNRTHVRNAVPSAPAATIPTSPTNGGCQHGTEEQSEHP